MIIECAVYQAVGKYEGGLLFIAVEDEKKWLELKDLSYQITTFDEYEFKRLGTMAVDTTIIDLQKTSPEHRPEIQILMADYMGWIV